MAKLVHVAVAVVMQQNNGQKEVLIAKRNQHQHQGGKWEFPGGKVEQGELVTDALAREMLEECNVQVISSAPLIKIEHDYGDKKVVLDTYVIEQHTGEANGNEGQEIRWVDVNSLNQYTFPEANKSIINAIMAYCK
ncbi:8-oxo-dGTP diphosphatase MutT [Catenovulum agarivorans]|uniref:8-oxo-dGTP diphosphatase MutT n=1 Tax=Catenovulum agarivorans TaxID=1172192 RepID=UPI0002FCC681|nr:8-oxo-dGTP diphosphatase MutT [Catenovulum agarivorans]